MSSKLKTVVFLNSSNRSRMSLGNLARQPDFMVSICLFAPFAQVMMWGVPLISTFSIFVLGMSRQEQFKELLERLVESLQDLLTQRHLNPFLNKTK